jgi:hypothetical protein
MRIIVLFNLKPGVSVADYERWGRESDIPGVRALRSVADYRIHRATGVLGSDEKPRYAYIEVIDIGDMALFGEEASGPDVQRLAADMRNYAEDPHFILTEEL